MNVRARGLFGAGGMHTGRWIWEPGTAAGADDAAFARRREAWRIQLTEILVFARVFLACYRILVRTCSGHIFCSGDGILEWDRRCLLLCLTFDGTTFSFERFEAFGVQKAAVASACVLFH